MGTDEIRVNERPCKYGCGKNIVFSDKVGKPPFVEVDSGEHHTYKRCADLLNAQGKNPDLQFGNTK
jgi:hypothetical protein